MTKLIIAGASLAIVGIVSLALKEIKDVVIENEHEVDGEVARFKAQTIDRSLPVEYWWKMAIWKDSHFFIYLV